MRDDTSSNSHSRLAWNTHALSCALIEFEPAQIFLDNRREFSLVWPTLHDSRWSRVDENSHESQLSSSFGPGFITSRNSTVCWFNKRRGMSEEQNNSLQKGLKNDKNLKWRKTLVSSFRREVSYRALWVDGQSFDDFFQQNKPLENRTTSTVLSVRDSRGYCSHIGRLCMS